MPYRNKNHLFISVIIQGLKIKLLICYLVSSGAQRWIGTGLSLFELAKCKCKKKYSPDCVVDTRRTIQFALICIVISKFLVVFKNVYRALQNVIIIVPLNLLWIGFAS